MTYKTDYSLPYLAERLLETVHWLRSHLIRLTEKDLNIRLIVQSSKQDLTD